MAVLVGLDEAGYGPILGPWVASSAAFSVGPSVLESDLWQVLSKSLGNKPKHLAGRVLVVDSKKAYNRKLGPKHLKRTTYAFLKLLGNSPETVGGLIELLSPDCGGRLKEYPWHKQVHNRKIDVEPADIEIASSVLGRDMEANNIELVGIRSCCLDVAHYNRLVTAVKNKASVLFTGICGLIKQACDEADDKQIQVIIDRQGGRVRYRRNLQRMFPEMELKIICENNKVSSYQLQADDKEIKLHFVVGADDRFLPVALASMVSKYLRELLVESINSYFLGFDAELKPTAGYWKDGLRFLKDLKVRVPHVNFDNDLLVRSR